MYVQDSLPWIPLSFPYPRASPSSSKAPLARIWGLVIIWFSDVTSGGKFNCPRFLIMGFSVSWGEVSEIRVSQLQVRE